ncbi:lipopolysaccharide biosynthesis protein [Euzebya tangerina]|uniref:lipopolysaccharide biosynthesis protein n=1 Tax=Euzebya tangerina TaxID=591198 RepID=UPI0013C354B2|nr:lipopolysaccharide biosynthesis protein [Euzebya tangerina]
MSASSPLPVDELPEATLGRSAGRSALVLFAAQWLSKAATTIVVIVLARLLVPEDFGIVAVATVAVGVLTAIADLGFGTAIVRHPDLTDRHLNTAFWASVATGALLTAVVASAAGPVATALGDSQATPILRLMALNSTLAALSSVQMGLLKRSFRFSELAVRNIVSTIGAAIVAIGLAWAGAGPYALAVQLLVGTALGCAMLWRVSEWRPSLSVGRSEFRDLLGFSASVTGIRLMSTANKNVDNLIISLNLGSSALGIYTIAYRFYRVVVDSVLTSVSGVSLPSFARLQHDAAAMRDALYRATRISALVGIPLFAGLGLVAPTLFPAVFGPQWDEAIVPSQFLVVNGVVMSVTYFSQALLLAKGRGGLTLTMNIARLIVNTLGFLIGVQYGIVGVAASVAITSVLFWPVQFLILRRVAGLSPLHYLRQVVVPVIGMIAMAAAVLPLQTALEGQIPGLLALVTLVAAGAVVYGLVAFVFDRDTLRVLFSLLRRSRSTDSSEVPTAVGIDTDEDQ